ncbi:MAG TPA: RagB/SusD family nutrient uptake outer membrane protein [Puia sp.]|nr:RagB/SusD family nutrient uptake outer membrane protein [Puia sp.]
MKTKLTIACLLCIIAWATGCSKYLDKKSSNSLVVPTSISDLQGLLDDAFVMNQQRTPSIGEASADDYFVLESNFDTRPQNDQHVYTWDMPYPSYNYSNDWATNYLPVYNSNYCLDMISKVAPDAGEGSAWNNVKGSALFYRAYYFTQLVWVYGKAYDATSSEKDPGIVLRLTSDFNIPSVRASVKDSYDRIIDDAKESISYLPALPAHPFRPSKTAAYGLLARVFLSMRQYDSAFLYANLFLQNDAQLMDYNGDNDIIGNINGTSSPFRQFNKETVFYTEIAYTTGIVNPTFAKIDTFLYSQYEGNDIRKSAFFTPNNGYNKFKGNYTKSNLLFTGIATDEVYLIRAECYAREGETASAMNDLNVLLSKRYDDTFIPLAASDASDALNKILLERRKELLMRGLRFIDIKRLNKEGVDIIPKRIIHGQTYTIEPNDNRYAIPIPTDIINQTGMPQNAY